MPKAKHAIEVEETETEKGTVFYSAVHHLSHCLNILFDPRWQQQCVLHDPCMAVQMFQSET